MKEEMKALLRRFDGDLTSLALLAYLTTLLNADERQLISLRDLSAKTGFGRKKLEFSLSRLVEYGFICIFIRPNRGVEIEMIGSHLCSLDLTLRSKEHTLRSKDNGPFTFDRSLVSKANGLTDFSAGVQSHSPLLLKKEAKVKVGSKTTAIVKTKTKAKTTAVKAPPKAKILKYSEADLELGRKWLDQALTQMKWAKAHKSWTPENFATALNKIKRQTDLNDQGLQALFDFIFVRHEGDFWRDKALSPSSLLKISDKTGIRKIDTILLQMKPKSITFEEKVASWNPSKEELEDPWGINR